MSRSDHGAETLTGK